MTQFRLIDRRRGTRQVRDAFAEAIGSVKRDVYRGVARVVVEASPVDSGTYIMAHAAGSGESGEVASRTSHGKARGRNPGQFKALALGNLRRSVSAAAVTAGQEIWFRNRSEHAVKVEYEGWPTKEAYHVYAKARAYAATAIRDAATELGFRTR